MDKLPLDSTSGASPILPSPYLNWKDRPPAVTERIQTVFDRLVSDHSHHWGFNGPDYCDNQYLLCGVKDHQIINTLINEASEAQKIFYFMDLGAGNFAWPKRVAKLIEDSPNFPAGKHVVIIGVRGEESSDDQIVKTDRVTRYSLGEFKIEALEEELHKHGLPAKDSMDLIVSHFTFRHLVDALGTFTQTYNALRPGTGILLADSGTFAYADQAADSDAGAFNMLQLLEATKAQFLAHSRWSDLGRMHFMLRRADDGLPCQLPVRYIKSDPLMRFHDDTFAECITRFEKTHSLIKYQIWFPSQGKRHLCGDRPLYDWLLKNDLLNSSKYTPLSTFEPWKIADVT